ncbi:hypothetical protein AB9Q10_20460 [Streptomyces krungchingensis]|uniref:hypothetical protein n=1 Tax=Streptomyces krungchingensis TaxID=1565034 RepID=UPI003CE92913
MRTAWYDLDFARALGRRIGRGLCTRLAGLGLAAGPMAPDPALLDGDPRTPPYGDDRDNGDNGDTPHRDLEVR